jgi:hypothetical protein
MTSAQKVGIGLAGLAGALLWLHANQRSRTPPSVPAPAPVNPTPAPAPNPAPCPVPGPCPREHEPCYGAVVNGRRFSDGTELQCDIPESLHLRNMGGSDGSGLCVFTSISHSARWQNVKVLQDFRDWMRSKPGGGYPSKVDRMILKLCSERSQPVPDYLQVEGTDLEILKKACRTGRAVCVTYSFSPTGRYGGGRIAHMVNLVHADDRHFVILDNNYPGANAYEWLSPEEFRRTYTGGSQGWAVILLSPPPPPPPI